MTAIEASAGPLAALVSASAILAAAVTVDEVKDVRDKAEALRLYSRQAGLGLEMQNHCAELKLRAERKAGELLAAMPMNPGGRSTTPTLGAVGLTFNQSSRWQRVASLPEGDFEALIGEAFRESKELTTASALKLAKRLTAHDKPDAPPLRLVTDDTPVEYPCIVIDPPWRYNNVATRGAAEDHYPTMPLDELAELKLPAADNAHLYLWVTNGFIRQGFDLLDAWDFTYKTILTWCKPQIGMGNWFRNSTEHVLFAVRGKAPTLRNDCPTHFIANRTKHSSKPESFYDLVESCSPGPWLEMFARRRRFHWDTWGNEA